MWQRAQTATVEEERELKRERNIAPYVAMPVQDEACNMAGPRTANIHG